ncbi:MAG: dephospho-CoA kinase [Hyphomicrobium sp.]
MLIVGLTGSIGMGKSTAAARFRQHGIPVFDADAEVHALYSGPLAAEIEAAFPGVVSAGRVDRTKLSAALLAAPHRFKELEAIVHPRVRAEQRAFLQCAFDSGAQVAVLEIPLLFEGNADSSTDVTVVVSADAAVQRQRVLARPGMTEKKFNELLARQMPDKDKRARANFIVDTSGSVEACNAQVDAIIAKIEQAPAHAYVRFWS